MKKSLLIAIIVFSVAGSVLFSITSVAEKMLPFLLYIDPRRPLDKFFSPKPVPHTAVNTSGFSGNLDDLVIVAHYDDEALAIGGYIRNEIKEHKNVGVVFVTFSEGERNSQRNWFGVKRVFKPYHWNLINRLRMLPSDITDYSLERENESNLVLSRLGVPAENRLYLRYPETNLNILLENPEQTITGEFRDPVSKKVESYSQIRLAADINDIIRHSSPKRIITHLPDDTNYGHSAIGKLVEQISKNNNIDETWFFLTHWNNKFGAWVPETYKTETAWLAAEPQDFFVPPLGSPTASVTETNDTRVKWDGDFLKWKLNIFPLYLSQYHTDSKTMKLFAKKNELLWDLKSGILHNYIYDTMLP